MKINWIGFIIALSLFIFSCGGPRKETPGQSAKDSLAGTISFLQRAVQQNPDSIGLRYRLADELANAGQYQLALSQTDSLLSRDSSNAVFWYKRGILEEKTGDTLGAISSLKRSISRAPVFLEPMLELTYLLASREDPESLKWADAVIQHAESPQAVSRARFLKGVYYANRKEDAAAMKEFDDCIRHDYTFMDAYIEKAILQYDAKKYNDALKTLEKAQTVSNSFTDAYFWMGKCFEAMGNKEQAIDNYKKALGLDPDYQEAQEGLERLK